jgi:hypothetical protein
MIRARRALAFLPFSKVEAHQSPTSWLQATFLQDSLSTWAEKMSEQAREMELESARDALLKKLEQAESAAKFEAWSSPIRQERARFPRRNGHSIRAAPELDGDQAITSRSGLVRA